MPEINVLKKRKDFIRVAKQGEKEVAKTLILQAALNFCADSTGTRIGLTATKKLGKAHVRNRVKRRLRAAIREIAQSSSLPNADYVIIGRYNTATADFSKIKEDLSKSFRRINSALKQGEAKNEKSSVSSVHTPN